MCTVKRVRKGCVWRTREGAAPGSDGRRSSDAFVLSLRARSFLRRRCLLYLPLPRPLPAGISQTPARARTQQAAPHAISRRPPSRAALVVRGATRHGAATEPTASACSLLGPPLGVGLAPQPPSPRAARPPPLEPLAAPRAATRSSLVRVLVRVREYRGIVDLRPAYVVLDLPACARTSFDTVDTS